jgi:hypothetical protein
MKIRRCNFYSTLSELPYSGSCAFTLQLLGWTLLDKTSLDASSLRHCADSSVSLDDYLTRITNAEAKNGHVVDDHVVDDWENITSDSPIFTPSTPFVLLRRLLCRTMETIMSYPDNACPDLAQEYNSNLRSLHLPWNDTCAFPSAAWANSFGIKEVFHSPLPSSLNSSRSLSRPRSPLLLTNSAISVTVSHCLRPDPSS